jgi:hypothetical protein
MDKLTLKELDRLEREYFECGYHWIGNGLMLKLIAAARAHIESVCKTCGGIHECSCHATPPSGPNDIPATRMLDEEQAKEKGFVVRTGYGWEAEPTVAGLIERLSTLYARDGDELFSEAATALRSQAEEIERLGKLEHEAYLIAQMANTNLATVTAERDKLRKAYPLYVWNREKEAITAERDRLREALKDLSSASEAFLACTDDSERGYLREMAQEARVALREGGV